MFRDPPSGLTRLGARAPLWLYRLRLGWLLGGRFLMLEHIGRKSRKRRRTVVEVLDHHRDTDTYWIAAAWGDRSDWYLNVKAEPKVRITVGSRRLRALAQPLSHEDSRTILQRYQAQHRIAARELTRVLGYESFDQLSRNVPVVELRPRD